MNHYQTLGIERDASGPEIRAAYVRLIKEAHPDVNPDDEQSTERARLIVEAYATLRDKKRRQDYDLTLLKTTIEAPPVPETRQQPRQTRPFYRSPWADAQPISCSTCGRNDEILNKYVFAWVVSFIFETRHGQDSFILCSRCRLLKSFNYLFRVLLLGWWAIPIGVLYTITALFQNLFGGVILPDDDASVLAAHGYWLFSNGYFREALDSFEQSQKLVPNLEKVRMIDRLQKLVLPLTRAERMGRRLRMLNPGWVTVPVTLLIIGSVVVAATLGNPFKPVSVAQVQSTNGAQLSVFNHDHLETDAKRLNFDLDRFDVDIAECATTTERASNYVHNSLPVVGTKQEGATLVNDYVFDRTKLSAEELEQFAQSIHNCLVDANVPIADVMNAQGGKPLRGDLGQYTSERLDFIRSCYYNVSILAISVAHTSSLDNYAQASTTSQELVEIENDPLMSNWMIRSGASERLASVMEKLEKEEQAQSVKISIEAAQTTIEQVQQQVDDLDHDMTAAKATGDFDSYNDLVPSYNADINTLKSENDDLNEKINRFNKMVVELNQNPIDEDFNNCIDGNILLNKFEFVNLKGKS